MKQTFTENSLQQRAFIFLASLLVTASLMAQENRVKHIVSDIITHSIVDNTQEVFKETGEFIEKNLDEKDSLYISPNLYNFTIMPQFSNSFEYYRFSSDEREQSITLNPGFSNKFGLYLGWRWIFLGYSINLDQSSPETDINLSFYTSKIGFDLFYRKRSRGFEVQRLKGFYDNGKVLKEYNHNFNGLIVRQKGFNVYYIFNNKQFSYPAAYSQSTNQRISAGSFILGINYNEQSFDFDYHKFDPKIQSQLLPELKFNEVKYHDFSVNFGYSYNWVFAKNCLANISLTPAIGYKNTSLRLKSSKEFLSNINIDFITRAAIVYNNSKYYAGASIVSNTYSYNKKSLSIINTFGVINVYIGFNFWRRK